MKNIFLLITAIALVTLSCKKVKLERLTIGDEKKMRITDVNTKITTSFTEFPGFDLPENGLDLDNDGEFDVLISLSFRSSIWVENEGDNLPWKISLELLNSNFSIREITGSDKFYSKFDVSVGESPDGIPMEVYDLYSGCENREGVTESMSSSYILTGDVDGKFEADENGNWSNDIDSNGFIVAQSPEKEIGYTEIEESETLIVQESYTRTRYCHEIDRSKPVYIQFKTAVQDYKLGWIELIFEADSFTINRHAISKKIIKE